MFKSSGMVRDQAASQAPPLRHTYAWESTSQMRPPSPVRAPPTKPLVLPPEGRPEKYSKHGRSFLFVKLELDLDVMGYIKKIHKAEVKEMEHRHQVQFR